MTTKNDYGRLYREFDEASRFDEQFGAHLAYTIEGRIYNSDGVGWAPCHTDHIFGPITINPSSGPVAYRDVRLAQIDFMKSIDLKLMERFKGLCKEAGAMLPRPVAERYGVPFDTTPELRWLGLVVEALRNHGLGYVKRSESDSPSTGPYCHDMIDRPFLACAKAILEAGLFDTGRKKPTRKRKGKTKDQPLTEKQVEAFTMVADCGGNIAEAARRLGRDRKTIAQHYKAAAAKAGKAVVKRATQAMPSDRRGQVMAATHDDGPGSIGPKPRVMRDRRHD